MINNVLEVMDHWFRQRLPVLEGLGLKVSITWGPCDRSPASAWLDFESAERSARLILWSDGQAELSIGDVVRGEILLDEHREISGEVGLDDAETSVLAWLT
jgi:hypothetical protein